jgi:hypothetical protein
MGIVFAENQGFCSHVHSGSDEERRGAVGG